MFILLLLIMLHCYCTYGKPVRDFKWTGTNVGDIGDAVGIDAHGLQYLHEAGYLEFSNHLAMSDNLGLIAAALRRFQKYAGIEITGKYDDATKAYMEMPRCGLPDMVKPKRRYRRYSLEGSSWMKKNITWALENSNNDGITDNEVRRIFKSATNKWQKHTYLTFEELVDEPEDSADIRIRFAEGKHEDCKIVFDGRGGTLAHSFYPSDNKGLSGDIHLDDHETFITKGRGVVHQFKLLYIATHELGHSLGIAHSEKKGAIMYSIYQDLEGNDFELTFDDVKAVQTIYGEKSIPTEAIKNTTTTETRSPACTNVMQAVYMGENNKLHVINDHLLYILYEDKEGVEKGPIEIKNHFPALTNVDAVFRRHYDEQLVFFHNERFTVYDNNNNLIDDYRKINDGFQGIDEELTHIDAAIIWPTNNKLYIQRKTLLANESTY